MATKPIIKIKSKDIYSKENPVILKNIIKDVSIKGNKGIISKNIENVEGFSLYVKNMVQSNRTKWDYRSELDGYRTYGFSSINIGYIEPQGSIYKTKNNKTILNILQGLDDEGNNNIQLNIRSKVKKGTIKGTLDVNKEENDPDAISNIEITWDDKIKEENIEKLNLTVTTTIYGVGITRNIIASFDYAHTNNEADKRYDLQYAQVEQKGNIFNWVFGVIPVYQESISMRYAGYDNPSDNGYKVNLSGTIEEYIPISATLTIKGEVLKLDLEESTFITNNQKNSSLLHKISGNELMQDENYYDDGDDEIVNLSANNLYAQNIVSQYIDGKKEITLDCSINDYYDTDGNKVVGDNVGKMLFSVGDLILPHKMNINMEDEPIWVDKNGDPVVFEIIEKSVRYRGVPMQKIKALEYTTSEPIYQYLTPSIFFEDSNANRIILTDNGNSAYAFDLYVDYVYKTTIYKGATFSLNAPPEPTYFDLTELNLTNGSYQITATAKADGFRDSQHSNILGWVVENNPEPDIPETTYTLNGYYEFNETIELPTQNVNVPFVNVGYNNDGTKNYTEIFAHIDDLIYYGGDTNAFDGVYSNSVWSNNDYRVIYIDNQTVDEFTYDWIIANSKEYNPPAPPSEEASFYNF